MENLPSEQMASAGRRMKLEPLYAARSFPPFPTQAFVKIKKKKEEQQRSIGNLTTRLFWETVHTRLFIAVLLHTAAAAAAESLSADRRTGSTPPHP